MNRQQRRSRKLKAFDHATEGWLGGAAKSLGMVPSETIEGLKRGIGYLTNRPHKDEPFWTGVVCGHWMIGKLVSRKSDNKKVHLVFSKCGVYTDYEPWQISAGKLPQTCWACRPGEHAPPPAHCVLTEEHTRTIQGFWRGDMMASVFEIQSSLKPGDASKDWDAYGEKFMARLMGMTNPGLHFGWKIFINSCSQKAHRHSKATDRVRVKSVQLTTRRIEMVLQPAGSHYEFTIFLATGRQDVPFKDIVSEVELAVRKVCPDFDAKEEQVKPEPSKVTAVAAAANPSENGHGVIDLAALSKLGDKLQKAIKVGGDLNALAKLKAEAEAELSKTMQASQAVYVELVKHQGERDDAVRLAEAHGVRVKEFEERLKNENMLHQAAILKAERAKDAAALSQAKYEPLEAEAEKCKAKLREIENMAAEAAASLGESREIQTLLAALSGVKL